MILSTTPSIEGKKIVKYLGVVTGEAIIGTNILKDIAASFRDVFGGRVSGYEKDLIKGREAAIEEMVERAKELKANAIVGIDIDYESISIGGHGSMLMISACGTAVYVE